MSTTTQPTTSTASTYIIEPVGVLRETSKAILFRFDQGDDTWLPKSQVTEVGFAGGIAGQRRLYEVPRWLVRNSGIVLNRALNPQDWER